MEIIDITLPISERTPVWAGDNPPEFRSAASIKGGDLYNSTIVTLGTHTGTHIDAPRHFIADGATLETIPLAQLTGKTQVVEIDEDVLAITAEILSNLDLNTDIHKLLFKTRNSNLWVEDPYSFRKNFTALTADGAAFLAEKNFEFVGIDSFSISVFSDLAEPHRILMDKGIVVLENADLHLVNPGVYTMMCLPLPFIGVEASPVRAVLIKDE